MRLTIRLMLVLLLALGGVLLMNASLRVRREHAVFVNDMRRDHLLLASSVATETLLEWHDHGEAGARAIVEKLNAQRAHIDIALRTVDELPLDVRAGLARGPVQDEAPTESALRTYAPLQLRGALVGAIRLRESMTPVREYVRSSMTRTAMSAVLGLGVAGVVALWFGAWLVGRPIDALMRKMRRIADGDLGPPLTIESRAELSTLASEINTMCERLAEARARATEETERRIAAVQQLRHADRLSTIGMLASGLAHELGTPLNIIGGRAKMIEAHVENGRSQEDARTIIRQTEKVTRIVRQLLDFGRATPSEHRPIDVNRSIADALTLITPIARERGVSIALAPAPGDGPRILGDASQLEQALMNVVVNAVQASERGATVRVRVTEDAAAGRVEIAVEDHGPGIAPENLERVFLPFFTTKGVGEGTGLGLAVAYGIVQDHRGSLRVSSALGQGSTFTFDLPRTGPS